MEHTKKIPAEAVDLYTRFIHGEINRRDFLRGVKRFAVAGLTATAIVEALMPNYALGQQVRKDDERIKASYETVPSPNGNGYIRGYFVRPFSADTRTADPGETARRHRRPREPGTQSAHGRCGTALCPGELQGICSGRAFVGRRLSGRRLQGRPALRQDRRRQAAPGFHRRRAVVEIASRLQRENLRDRFLLRRRHGQYALPSSWARIWPRRRRSTAARPSRKTWPKIKAAILIHHGALDKPLVGGLSGAGSGAEEKQHPLRRPHLSEFRAWLLQ